VEGIDERILDTVRRRGGAVPALPPGSAWLYVEVGGAVPAEALALGGGP